MCNKIQLLKGGERWVLLIFNWAIKVPQLKYLKSGLYQNRNEIAWWNRTFDKRLCPILINLFLGYIVIMKRAEVMQDDDFKKHFPDFNSFTNFADNKDIYPNSELQSSHLPCEYKPESFGIINGKIVITDYGNYELPKHD